MVPYGVAFATCKTLIRTHSVVGETKFELIVQNNDTYLSHAVCRK